MTHTPGPWTLNPRRPIFASGKGTITVDMAAAPQAWTIWRQYRDEHGRKCSRPIAETFVVGQDYEAAEANARLVVGAPDLLEALKEARGMLKSCGFTEPEPDLERSWKRALKRIDAALTKAEAK